MSWKKMDRSTRKTLTMYGSFIQRVTLMDYIWIENMEEEVWLALKCVQGWISGYQFRYPDFWSSLIKENCHNSGTSDGVHINLGVVTRLDKRNKTPSKKFDHDIMSENFDVIVIFRIFGQFRAVRRQDSGHRVCKSYFFSNSNLLPHKHWKQN